MSDLCREKRADCIFCAWASALRAEGHGAAPSDELARRGAIAKRTRGRDRLDGNRDHQRCMSGPTQARSVSHAAIAKS
jgi:hypothetical protein